MSTQELKDLKAKLLQRPIPETEVNKFLGYIAESLREEQKKTEESKKPVTKNSLDTLYSMCTKFYDLGLTIDGVNVVITGKNMAMVTFHGYKNKVKSVYPSAKFDIQLIRKGDDFEVWKQDGVIHYKHKIADPFGIEEIIGAYSVITIDGVGYFESLNPKDYEEMKKSSKQQWLWNKWDSEFWLKSVIKRACKRHFYDIVSDIDKNDNEDFGLRDDQLDEPEPEITDKIRKAKDPEALQLILDNLTPEQKLQVDEEVNKKIEDF